VFAASSAGLVLVQGAAAAAQTGAALVVAQAQQKQQDEQQQQKNQRPERKNADRPERAHPNAGAPERAKPNAQNERPNAQNGRKAEDARPPASPNANERRGKPEAAPQRAEEKPRVNDNKQDNRQPPAARQKPKDAEQKPAAAQPQQQKAAEPQRNEPQRKEAQPAGKSEPPRANTQQGKQPDANNPSRAEDRNRPNAPEKTGEDNNRRGAEDNRRGPDTNKPNEANAPQQPNRAAGANNQPKRLDDVRRERKETKEGNRTIIREDNRTIVRENNITIIRHDDTDRFRRGARDVHVERRGDINRTVIVRPNGDRIINETDANGRLLRRVRVVNGREYVLIDNRYQRRPGAGFAFIVALPPPVIHIPRDHYIVEIDRAPPPLIYETLVAPPVEPITTHYTLDQIRYNATVRERMPRIDIDTITFESGSWEVAPDQARLLAPIADAMKRAIAKNPNEVYLIEGHTDAVGSPEDNLSLSDRRAEAVAEILTQDFGIPPENLVTQGYGEQGLKVQTEGPSQANRRVTVRRITPLLVGQK
jgi:outer membrane protein OmpA-like peptidoglycan-associated protein